MKFIVLLVFSISTSFAATFDQCALQGDKLGDGKGNDVISSECLGLLSNSLEVASSSGADFKVFGYKSILITKDLKSGELKYISGKSSRLSVIGALHFDQDVMRSLVYNPENHYLLSFNSKRMGNIAPIFRFELKDIEGEVKQVLQLPEQGYNLVLFSNNEIRFYLSEATEFAPNPKNSTDIKFKLVDKEGAFGTISLMSYRPKDNLLILTTEKGKFSIDIEKLPSVVIKKIL